MSKYKKLWDCEIRKLYHCIFTLILNTNYYILHSMIYNLTNDTPYYILSTIKEFVSNIKTVAEFNSKLGARLGKL